MGEHVSAVVTLTLHSCPESQNANTTHVKVIVDAADLASQVREEAAEKNL